MSELMVVSGTSLSYPGNGQGSAIVARASGTSSAGTTYTRESVTDSANWTVAAAKGDLIVTQDGYWAAVISISGAGPTTIVVDHWRKFPRQGPNADWVPTAGQTATVYAGPSVLIGTGWPVLQKINFFRATANDTVILKDAAGNTLWTYRIGGTAGDVPIPPPIDFGDDSRSGGWDINGIFSVTVASANTTVALSFRSGGRGA